MLIDTHCHLYHKRFEADRNEVISRARTAGLAAILLPAIDIPSIEDALALCRSYQGIYAMTALHPTETKEATEDDLEMVVDYCDDPHVVAVGESGLDYYWDQSFIPKQQDMLRFHARLAIERDLPLVLHNRDKQNRADSSGDLIRILSEEQANAGAGKRLFGVFHCFGGSQNFADQVMGLGFHVGLGGTLTFKNAGVPEAIEHIPMDRIVLETDAPFLAPVPHRGERNEPSYTRLVAEKLAEVRGMSFEDIASATTANARRLFKLDEVDAKLNHTT
ncbi:MAG: TatD family hydrolase [Rubricoccaceae bacterium]|nr:TatD family hydrolase [Rubricoccaceae bacterium]